MTLLGGEGERGSRASDPAGEATGEVEEDGSGIEARGLDGAVLESLTLEGALDGGEGVWVVEGEAVEVDGGGGITGALEVEGVGALEEDALGDVGFEGVRGEPVPLSLGEEGAVEGDADAVVEGAAVSLPPWSRTRSFAVPGARASREKG